MAQRHIKICLGSSCFSRGNNSNLPVIKSFLAEHGLEAEVTFAGRLCEGMCGRGPVVVIDGNVFEEVNVSRLHKILKEEFGC